MNAPRRAQGEHRRVQHERHSALRGAAAAALLVLASGCGGLLPAARPAPLVYTLEAARLSNGAVAPTPRPVKALTLVVNPPRAAPGFDSWRIIYVRSAHRLEHFAQSEWVDTPARMLAPLIISALQDSGGFHAVGAASSGLTGELRLNTEVLRLQQEFGNGPSRVRFTLRAHLLDDATRRVIAWREFDEIVIAGSDDPVGGVAAANRAVQSVLAQLASLFSEAARADRPHGLLQPK